MTDKASAAPTMTTFLESCNVSARENANKAIALVQKYTVIRATTARNSQKNIHPPQIARMTY